MLRSAHPFSRRSTRQGRGAPQGERQPEQSERSNGGRSQSRASIALWDAIDGSTTLVGRDRITFGAGAHCQQGDSGRRVTGQQADHVAVLEKPLDPALQYIRAMHTNDRPRGFRP